MSFNNNLNDSCHENQTLGDYTLAFGITLHRSKWKTSLGGFEPPTFWLTAERANRLRHKDCVRKIENYQIIDIFLEYNIFSIFDIFYALVSPSDKKVQYENY